MNTTSPPPFYEKLKEVRASTGFALKPCSSYLKPEIALRYYQGIGTYHFVKVPRMVLGDACGLGKTLQAIAALCYLFIKDPTIPVMVLAPRSALFQWASEIEKFTEGIKPVVVSGSRERRKKIYERYVNSDHLGPSVLILTYETLVQDWKQGSEIRKGKDGKPVLTRGLMDAMTITWEGRLTVIADEISALKNPSSQRWQIAKLLADRSARFWGMTATLLKNNLMEGFGIYKLLLPDLFGTKTSFMDDFCHVRRLRKGNREIPIITGFKNIPLFKQKIDPYFLGRHKHEVTSDLPTLITKEVTFEIDASENAKYREALEGILELGSGEIKDYSETKAMTSLVYAQKIVDSLTLLEFQEGDTILTEDTVSSVSKLSSKEDALMDLLTGDFDGEKVIVYTRFASHVPRLQAILEKNGIKNVAITGSVSTKGREKAKKAFQEGDATVIFITDAASEAVNLQAASAMIFFNAPWSWGQTVQILGRMIRIGSPHRGVIAVHMVATRPGGGRTIDHHVLKLLKSKKNLIEQVLGVSTEGSLDFSESSGSSAIADLLQEFRRDHAHAMQNL